MEYLKPPLVQLVGDECSTSLLNFNLQDTPCIKLLISKCLGVAIVLGGSILKVPQIVKIMNAKSARGISFTSYLLETMSYSVNLCYNYRLGNPLSTYGESVFITMQNIFVLMLMLFYKKNFPGLILLSTGYLFASYLLYDDSWTPSHLLTSFQWASIFLSTASKLPQVYNNYVNSSTGNLSAITVMLQFGGSAARVFTTLQEVQDMAILTSFLLATSLNAIVAMQVVWYWNSPVAGVKTARTKAKKKQ